jgi:hypothetical protein
MRATKFDIIASRKEKQIPEFAMVSSRLAAGWVGCAGLTQLGEQLGAGRRKRDEGSGFMQLELAAFYRDFEARAVLGWAAAVGRETAR